MTKLILYLLESSAMLAFFYLIYILILSRETFFSLNRFFLLGILVFSMLFPFISLDFNVQGSTGVQLPVKEISEFRRSYYESMTIWEFETLERSRQTKTTIPDVTTNSESIWLIIMLIGVFAIYIIGIIVSLYRTFRSLKWIRKMIMSHELEGIDGVEVVKILNPVAPFSFLNYVFVHHKMIGTQEFDQILMHEKTHIQQMHSVDLIFVQLLAAFFWFNPLVWQLLKSLKTTHEYIADKKIIKAGYSLVEYQSLLLRQLISNNSSGLVHNFNLSFIKKRITMMKNKKSGWSGKVKVAMAIASTMFLSALIVQCNSNTEEQASLEFEVESNSDFTEGINLPVLPKTGLIANINPDNALYFSISGNKLTINGENYEVEEIGQVIEKSSLSDQGEIVIRIDRNQTMALVRNVQWELRKADRRKILYLGKTDTGEKVEMAMLLPPTPGKPTYDGKYLPHIDDQYIAETGVDILYIKLGDNAGVTNQKTVYDFVQNHMRKQSDNYVVSAKYDDDDTYNDYLVNLTYIQEGFNQIYQERAQQMFGKDFYELDKPDYHAVRKGIPRAISIAEGK